MSFIKHILRSKVSFTLITLTFLYPFSSIAETFTKSDLTEYRVVTHKKPYKSDSEMKRMDISCPQYTFTLEENKDYEIEPFFLIKLTNSLKSKLQEKSQPIYSYEKSQICKYLQNLYYAKYYLSKETIEEYLTKVVYDETDDLNSISINLDNIRLAVFGDNFFNENNIIFTKNSKTIFNYAAKTLLILNGFAWSLVAVIYIGSNCCN